MGGSQGRTNHSFFLFEVQAEIQELWVDENI